MVDRSPFATRSGLRGRIEASIFATFAVLHLPGAVVAVAHPTTTGAASLTAAASVLLSCALWAALAAAALHALGRGRQVPRGLLSAAFALDTVVLTVSGLSPPRPGNTTAASLGILALCAAAALLTRPRLLPVVLVPAVVGQATLLRAADSTATTAQLVADVATATATTVAMAVLIAWLEHERRRGRAALASAAHTDPLTGLLNRRGLEQGLPALLAARPSRTRPDRPRRRRTRTRTRTRRSDTPAPQRAADRSAGTRVVVVVVDIDSFKGVNDLHGHDVGDAVLVAVAGAMRDCARGDDLQVRLGGEELAWVALWPTTREAAAATERLRALVAERTRELGVPVTVSAGIAAAPALTTGEGAASAGEAVQALGRALTLADRALYRAKAAGRDRVELAPDEGPVRTPAPA